MTTSALARINPALLARRSAKKVSVTAEIVGPFAERGRGVTFSAPPPKAASPSAIAKAKAPPAATPTETPPNFDAPPLPPSQPITFAPRAMTPTATAPLEKSRFEITPTNEEAQLSPIKSGRITVSLDALAELWPNDLKQQLLQPPFAGASIVLPESLIAAGLKRGRVTATWKQLRLLVAADSVATPNDALELVLPLKLIAPLFLALKKNAPTTQTKVAVKSEIPDLFFGFPQPATPSVIPGLPALPKPTTNSIETNYFTPGGQNLTTASEVSNPTTQTVQTDFTSRQTTPKEAVTRALALPGVVGSVVALPDGLRVASEVPADLNADTLAAFLPQIFERVNQSTRELRMGALNNVSFTVGNVPWKIFRVNSVYFAAFGRAGESLPSAQLVQLAAEIDRKNNQ